MTLIGRISNGFGLINAQAQLIQAQQQIIASQEQQLHAVHLEHLRDMRGIVSAWLLNLEQPEIDLRHDLAELDQDLSRRAAILEEHVL